MSGLMRSAAILEQRVRATMPYFQLRARAQRLATEAFLACATPDDFRAQGGRTSIAREALIRAVKVTPSAWNTVRVSICHQASVVRLLSRDLIEEIREPAYWAEQVARGTVAASPVAQ
jgi:hypothetical protein